MRQHKWFRRCATELVYGAETSYHVMNVLKFSKKLKFLAHWFHFRFNNFPPFQSLSYDFNNRFQALVAINVKCSEYDSYCIRCTLEHYEIQLYESEIFQLLMKISQWNESLFINWNTKGMLKDTEIEWNFSMISSIKHEILVSIMWKS